MLVLVATSEGQGEIEGDFCWTVEGELVVPAIAECGDPERCGCGRSFQGLASHRATTTAKVAEVPDLDEDVYGELVRAAVVATVGGGPDVAEEAWDLVDHVCRAAEWFGEGVVVGCYPGGIRRRGFTVTPPV